MQFLSISKLVLFIIFFYTTMTLNCLTCKVLKRTDSDEELQKRINHVEEKSNFRLFPGGIERNWSGNLVSKPRVEKRRTRSLLGQETTPRKDARRIHNSGPMEYLPDTPKLARSPGMRRDWSFEDLRQVIKR
ncbi:hypothetical protein P3S67_029104 [Capsicum chacoense]